MSVTSEAPADAEQRPGLLSWLPDGTIVVHDPEYAERIIGMRGHPTTPVTPTDAPVACDTAQGGTHDGH